MKTDLGAGPGPCEPEYLPAGSKPVEVSIVLPTFNERENLPVLIGKLQDLMLGHSYEIIIVDDDSEDGTWQIAEDFARRSFNISLIRRINRKGLSSAITEGMLLGKGQYLVVMDADLQHDHTLLLPMIDEIRDCDMVIGSRY
jgi:dolichol-phosphate mannosyltransferase